MRKQPWQMTRSQYEEALFATQLAMNEDLFPEYRRYRRELKDQTLAEFNDIFGNNARAGRETRLAPFRDRARAELDRMLGVGAFDKLEVDHELQVQAALTQGKRVPARVLQDYPRLRGSVGRSRKARLSR